MDEILNNLRGQSTGLQDLLDHLPTYEVEDISGEALEELTERIETVKDDCDEMIRKLSRTEIEEHFDPKQTAYLGVTGTPTQQEWASILVTEYNDLKNKMSLSRIYEASKL